MKCIFTQAMRHLILLRFLIVGATLAVALTACSDDDPPHSIVGTWFSDNYGTDANVVEYDVLVFHTYGGFQLTRYQGSGYQIEKGIYDYFPQTDRLVLTFTDYGREETHQYDVRFARNGRIMYVTNEGGETLRHTRQ
jgi:hypothetical protein